MLLATDKDILSNATDLASLPNTCSILHLSVTIVAVAIGANIDLLGHFSCLYRNHQANQ
jgi:hypothetical protein